MKYIHFIIFLALSSTVVAQSNIIGYYPLNGVTYTEEIVNSTLAKSNDYVVPISNRLNETNSAIAIQKGSIQFSPLQIKAKQESSLAFWIYINPNDSSQILYANDPENNLIFGIQQYQKRIVLNIHHKLLDNSFSLDKLWLWENVGFNQGEGWYFLAIDFSTNGTNFYLCSPDGKIADCYSSFVLNWELINNWGVGGSQSNMIKGIDDLRIYQNSLSKESTYEIYKQESRITSGPYSLTNVRSNNCLKIGTSDFEWYILTEALNENNQIESRIVNRSELLNLALDSKSTPILSNTSAQNWEIIFSDQEQIQIVNPLSELTLSEDENHSNKLLTNLQSDNQKWILKKSSKEFTSQQLDNNHILVSFDRLSKSIKININLASKENCNVKIHDITGKVIHNCLIPDISDKELLFDLNQDGIYIVQVLTKSIHLNKKIIASF